MSELNNDFALSVGIGTYGEHSGLGALAAARDAEWFHEWVTSLTGGGVAGVEKLGAREVRRAQLVTSPAQQQDYDPRPTEARIEAYFRGLHRVAKSNRKQGLGFRVGRRLYLFFSGHGMSLGPRKITALLTADAEPPDLLPHFAGRLWADHFRLAGAFDQVLLFMDCCRHRARLVSPRPPVFKETLGEREAKRLYAFATRTGDSAFQIEYAGQKHGLLTVALRQALAPAGGVSARQLGQRLEDNILALLSKHSLIGEPVIEGPSTSLQDFEILPDPAGSLERTGSAALLRRPDVFIAYAVCRPSLITGLRSGLEGRGLRVASAPLASLGEARHASRTAASANVVMLMAGAERPAREGRVSELLRTVGDALRREDLPERAALPGLPERLSVIFDDDPSDEGALSRRIDELVAARIGPRVLLASADSLAQIRVEPRFGPRIHSGWGRVALQAYAGQPYDLHLHLGGAHQHLSEQRFQHGQREVLLPPVPFPSPLPLEDCRGWDAASCAAARKALAAVPAQARLVLVAEGMLAHVQACAEALQPAAVLEAVPGHALCAFAGQPPPGRCTLQLSWAPGESAAAPELALSLPVAASWRTEVYLSPPGSAGLPNHCSIRMVPAVLPVGTPLAHDRQRESLRAALAAGQRPPLEALGALPDGDPILLLLAAALAIRCDERDQAASLVQRYRQLLGAPTQDADCAALQPDASLATPPLMADLWAYGVLKQGLQLEAGSQAEQLAGRMLDTAPWLMWIPGRRPPRSWLPEMASQYWPGWERGQAPPSPPAPQALARDQLFPADAIERTLRYKAPPIERLELHRDIAFLGASNDQLPAALAVAFQLRGQRRWQRLQVWSLEDEVLRQVTSAGRRGEALLRPRDRAEELLGGLLPRVAERWSLCRYRGLKLGEQWRFASLWDWQGPGGYVHSSPYVPGQDVRVTEQWNPLWEPHEPAPPEGYAEVVRAFRGYAGIRVLRSSP